MIRRAKDSFHSAYRRLEAARRPIILMYHRVAEIEHDPWRMAVTPANFRAQIEHLMSVREVVPLSQILETPHPGGRQRAAVTFDDGYCDIYTAARPILQALDCPATVFLTTGAVGADREFWWDELTRLILEPPALPDLLTVESGGASRTWRVGSAEVRRAIHDEVWSFIRPLAPDEQRNCLEQLARQIGIDLNLRPIHRPMTRAEVQDLRGSTIQVGAHTVTHPKLSELSPADAAAEIGQSRTACEELTGEPVTTFAYPFGDHNDQTVDAVRAQGLTLACTVEPGGIGRAADPLRLPRWAVEDMNRARFARWLP